MLHAVMVANTITVSSCCVSFRRSKYTFGGGFIEPLWRRLFSYIRSPRRIFSLCKLCCFACLWSGSAETDQKAMCVPDPDTLGGRTAGQRAGLWWEEEVEEEEEDSVITSWCSVPIERWWTMFSTFRIFNEEMSAILSAQIIFWIAMLQIKKKCSSWFLFCLSCACFVHTADKWISLCIPVLHNDDKLSLNSWIYYVYSFLLLCNTTFNILHNITFFSFHQALLLVSLLNKDVFMWLLLLFSFTGIITFFYGMLELEFYCIYFLIL